MITERTLRKWRREALVMEGTTVKGSMLWEQAARILALTGELLDQALLRSRGRVTSGKQSETSTKEAQ